MTRLLVALCFIHLIGIASPLHAQYRASLEPADSLSVTELTPEAAQAAAQRETAYVRKKIGDYRYEGLAIGGALFGTVGVLIGQICGPQTTLGSSSGCGDTGNSIALGLLGAVVGGGIGYLIGWTAPKYSALPDTVEIR